MIVTRDEPNRRISQYEHRQAGKRVWNRLPECPYPLRTDRISQANPTLAVTMVTVVTIFTGAPPVSKISSPSTQSSRPPRIPRPHDEIRRVQRGRTERISRISLRQRAVILMKQRSHRPGRICSLYPTCKPPGGTRKCRIPRSPSESPRYFAAPG